MNTKYLKDILLLAGIIIIAAVGARFLAGGETLSDYAKNNPEAADTASTLESSDSSSPDDSADTPNPSITDASSVLSSQAAIADNEDDSKLLTPPPSPERTTYMDGFYYEPISNEVFKRISGISYPVDCQVSLEELRYVVLQYVDFNEDTRSGEMICNKDLAQDIVEIFYELYRNGYQIESIKLIDEFDGDDTASMLANNTSCFNYRVAEGTTRLSNHAKGRAIDINPFYNPYITYNKDGSTNISPTGSEAYADRTISFAYKIDENDLAYRLFTAHGFTWGGNWNSCKDYQHFEKK